VRPVAALLVQAGLRPTRQRSAILRAMEGRRRPVTAQALHAMLARPGRAGRSGPADGPGLATVYRTLQALEHAGRVRTFAAREGEIAYKLCQPGHHHHLICERCGRVVEIPSCEVEEWAAQVAARRGFEVSSHQADIYGVCERCLEEGAA
jgi:Fur family ferric uptake transcriptional regulator